MGKEELRKTALELVRNGKGILAIDESPNSIQQKFENYNISNTAENRRRFRNMLIETEGIEKYISGVILHTETFEQRNEKNNLFVDSLLSRGIMPGIKLDQGLVKIDYDDVKIKVQKKAKEMEENVPADVKSSVKNAGDKVVDFMKQHSEYAKAKVEEQERPLTEEEKAKNRVKYGDYIKRSSSDNAEERYHEQISKGLEDLEKTLASQKYKKAKFAKWRSVFTITYRTPTFEAIDKNCDVLAKYAQLCLLHELVPIVEPEILFEGQFTIEAHYRVLKYVLSLLVNKLNYYNVDLTCVLFKIGFVTDGKDRASVDKNSTTMFTQEAIMSSIPPQVPGIVFLSGGHTYEDAIDYLKMISNLDLKMNLTYSYGRALTSHAMQKWNGNDNNMEEARKAFIEDCQICSEASKQRSMVGQG
ncbi:hypothetical protein VCUG_01691 [Vavraia culicis subsp. floridensis]|uniref:fructose-bisphosphate aldolase n=1 Tax=Vavraia culicis (isolate floridensis) TaxID=948595 RepID=L2GU26_VAVCU|nr:uncharacterized protein VCUG_01691 [Vavraia culicis subsp. floridensis]ELA46847.1 hypothetical protein VCUG_01691 [Vavraia culicis subsp. floridensis]